AEGVAVDRARVLVQELLAAVAIVGEPEIAVTHGPVAEAKSAVLRAKRGVQRVRLEPGGACVQVGERVLRAECVETRAQVGTRALLERAIGRVEQRVTRVVSVPVTRVPAGYEPALDLALGDEPLE